MNGAWLINSAMILMAAVAFVHTGNLQPTIQEAYRTLGPLFGRAAALVFAVALPVSYTHLDVYKRQIQGQNQSVSPRDWQFAGRFRF